MGVQPVPLDDLIGMSVTFTKLQELLKQLISSSNDQDAAIQQLRDDADKTRQSLEQRLGEQDVAVAEVRAKVDASADEVQKAVAQAEASRSELVGQTEAMRSQAAALEAKLAGSLGSVEELLATRLAPLEASAAAAQAQQTQARELLESRLAATEAARSEAVRGLEAQFAEAARARERSDAEANSRLAEMRTTIGAVSEQQKHMEGGLAELKSTASEDLAKLQDMQRELAQVGELRALCEEASTAAREAGETASAAARDAGEGTEARLAALEAQLKSGLEGLDARIAADGVAVKKLEDAVRGVQSGSNLRNLVEALAQKMDAEMGPLKRQLDDITAQLNDFLSKGASATANCLCCGGMRSTVRDKFVTGTDGKTYFKASGGDVINLGRIPSASNLPTAMIPSSPMGGRRVLSPVRATGGKQMGVSQSVNLL
mmetsp:Transcript_1028/g.2646  ORF Transcript_1028/g.2646 Transcript_1028/m.2646 type:complete len:431 (-) Transcript_1028:29-1321(-)